MVHFEFLNDYPAKQKLINFNLIMQVPPIRVNFDEILNIISKIV